MVTSAFVGAGIVALGAASNLPDAKAVSPTVLADLEHAAVTADDLAERSADAQRASRDNDRDAVAVAAETPGETWVLPLDDYTFTSAFGVRFDKLHGGIDLAAREGTPYKAVADGVVKAAGYQGGYGYSVTITHSDGSETVYAHSRRVLVTEGQAVKAGDIIGEVGNTGYSYGPHLHLELHVNGAPVDPIPALRDRCVDIKIGIESICGDVAP